MFRQAASLVLCIAGGPFPACSSERSRSAKQKDVGREEPQAQQHGRGAATPLAKNGAQPQHTEGGGRREQEPKSDRGDG